VEKASQAGFERKDKKENFRWINSRSKTTREIKNKAL
jgi:hypothetical protein